jgi:hypothetical protein
MGIFAQRDRSRLVALAGAAVVLGACNLPAVQGIQNSPPGEAADILFTNGTILTMDPAHPTADSLAIRDHAVLAVGEFADVSKTRGDGTHIIDLGGRTMLPGFIDVHSHIAGWAQTDEDFSNMQADLLRGGVTTTTEMGVTPEILDKLIHYESRRSLRLRFNTYLLFNTNCGEPFDPEWYRSRPPRTNITAHIRNQGVKVFADGGSCNAPAVSFDYPGDIGQGDLYMTQEQMNQVVALINADGYQLAIHALGDRAIEQVMNAIQAALAGGPNTLRHRIEHNGVVRPDVAPRYGQIGIVPVISGAYSTCLRFNPGTTMRYIVPDEVGTYEWAYRSILDASPGVHAAWHVDWPVPVVQHFDAMQNLYGFVTRNEVAEDGHICEAPDFLKNGAITAQEALQVMTMGSAYALCREDEIGSLEPGKLADAVILSENPLQVPSESIKDIHVLMTMIDGNTEYCAEGSERFCPG